MCIFRLLQRFPCSRNPEQVELGVRATPNQFPPAPLHMHAGQAPVPAAGGLQIPAPPLLRKYHPGN